MISPAVLVNPKQLVPIPNTNFILDRHHQERINLLDDRTDYIVVFVQEGKPLRVGIKFRPDLDRPIKGPFIQMMADSYVLVESYSENELFGWVATYTNIELDTDSQSELDNGLERILNLLKTLKPTLYEETLKFKSNYSKLDIIANFYLKDNVSKLAYIQSFSYLDKVRMTVDAFAAYTRRQKKSSEKKPAESEEPPQEKSLEERLNLTPFPPEVKEKVFREFARTKNLTPSSQEYNMIVDYLTHCLDLPFGKYVSTQIDISKVMEELTRTHYGLEDVKQHIIEHLAVDQLRGSSSGTVMCFNGEPGTGKTSIAKSIANALGRPLVAISLGGLNDESELKGHRRTYLGARPGRFTAGLKDAKSMSPVFLLDEIDKVAAYKGDPSAALLDLLDAQQNSHFQDRYFEFPLDFSKCMFIATSNNCMDIQPALRDRMEMIEFRAYTLSERRVILRHYVVPSAIKHYNLVGINIIFTEEVLEELSLIPHVRQIELMVKKLLRQAAVRHITNKENEIIINELPNSKPTEQQKRMGF